MARPLANPLIAKLHLAPVAVIEPDIELKGTTGDDVMFGSSGSDLLSGLDGDDTIFGGWGDDSISGDVGEATLTAGDAPVAFGNDILFGMLGDNRISGDADHLLVDSGDGDVSVATGNDLILAVAYSWSIGDIYRLEFQGGDASTTASVVMGDDVIVGNGGGSMWGDAYYVDLNYIEEGTIFVGFGDDKLYGGNYMAGDASSLTITENYYRIAEIAATFDAGNDLLSGSTGDDLIYGDFIDIFVWYYGDSIIVVNFGDDLIEGGRGDDYLVGDMDDYISNMPIEIGSGPIELNFGSDSFIFEGAFGDDWVEDFQVGLDLLVIEGFGVGFDDLDIQIGANGADISLEAFGGGTILLADVFAIDETSFQFI